jgi:hypothetical protein
MPAIGFLVANGFATVLNDARAFRDITRREYAVAVHLGTPNDMPRFFYCCHG